MKGTWNVLDLFSGIGGFSLGLERAGMRTVGFCERDEYCRAVLRKHWPGVICFDDIRTLDADRLGRLGRIDVVTGGFPCQPFSVAGAQRGKEDDRHLWPEMFRVIALTRPAWVIAENVTGLITLALDDVLADLEGAGYAARPVVIPAASVGAPHRRDRLWIIATDAHGNGRRRHEPERRADRRDTDASGDGEEGNVGLVADADRDALRIDEQRQARRRDDVPNEGQAEFADDGDARDVADAAMLFGRSLERHESNGADAGGEILADADSGRCEGQRQPELAGFEGACGRVSDRLREVRELEHPAAIGDVADTDCDTRPECRLGDESEGEGRRDARGSGECENDVADARRPRLSSPEPSELRRARRRQERRAASECDWWAVEPPVGRMAHGIPRRVDRLRCLGNAVVPQIVEEIGRAIMSSGRS